MGEPAPQLRWRLAKDEDDQRLFCEDELQVRHRGHGAYRGLEFFEVRARTIINSVPAASRMPFRHTINVYRGCSHACTYCFARPTHAYLNLGIGRDFEQKIVVKINAVERLRAELASPRWQGSHIAMGTNTDPYQAAEGKYHLTRGVVSVLAEHRNPFSILTKSTLVLRDLGLLAEAARSTEVRLNFSIGTLDRAVWRDTEPGTPPPQQRIEALRRLCDAGISCGVLIAPVLPGLSDSKEQLEALTAACVEAGAVSITPIALHLRPGVKEHFLDRLASTHPHLDALYASRFARGSYQAHEAQERISTIVKEQARRSGLRSTARRLTKVAPDDSKTANRSVPEKTSSPHALEAKQLSF